jgi:hypothetical protein
VLHRGVQLVAAKVGTAGDYYSRAINAGGQSRVRVIFEAQLPGGAGVAASIANAAHDPTLPASWHDAPNVQASPVGDGWLEMQHELAAFNADAVRLRLALNGHTGARPRLRNLRVIVL